MVTLGQSVLSVCMSVHLGLNWTPPLAQQALSIYGAQAHMPEKCPNTENKMEHYGLK